MPARLWASRLMRCSFIPRPRGLKRRSIPVATGAPVASSRSRLWTALDSAIASRKSKENSRFLRQSFAKSARLLPNCSAPCPRPAPKAVECAALQTLRVVQPSRTRTRRTVPSHDGVVRSSPPRRFELERALLLLPSSLRSTVRPMRRHPGVQIILLFLFPVLLFLSTTWVQADVRITDLTNRLRIEINGRLFTEYFFRDVARPYYYPLLGPGEAPMTRNWPLKTVPGEAQDHQHHRSLWFAHGNINGKDFWSEQGRYGKTIHEGFDEIKSGRDSGIIKSHNEWVSADGAVVCTDSRTFRVYDPGSAHERVFDFEITLRAANGDVTFGDTKEGSMAIRLAETMKLKAKSGPGGHIVLSTGIRDLAAWGKRADWCDYYGPVEGKTMGVAIFD